MTLCLTCLPACSTSTARADVDAVRVLKGWTAPTPGYFLTDAAMRDTVAGWTTAKQEAGIRQQALEALREEITAQQADLKRQLAELQHEIADERRLWRRRVRRGKTQGLVYGVLAGFAGGYLVRRNNP